MDVKPLGDIAKKWTTQTPAAAPYYEAGVKSPRRSWAAAASDAQENYAAGVQAAISNGSFGKGVQAAGDEAWRKGALEKGVSRWPQGVRMSGPKYQNGFSKYHGVLAGLTLSPRAEKGNPSNYTRVQEVGEALHEAKVGGGA